MSLCPYVPRRRRRRLQQLPYDRHFVSIPKTPVPWVFSSLTASEQQLGLSLLPMQSAVSVWECIVYWSVRGPALVTFHGRYKNLSFSIGSQLFCFFISCTKFIVPLTLTVLVAAPVVVAESNYRNRDSSYYYRSETTLGVVSTDGNSNDDNNFQLITWLCENTDTCVALLQIARKHCTGVSPR